MGIFDVSNENNSYLEISFAINLKATGNIRKAIKKNNCSRALDWAHSNFVGHATSAKAPRLDNLLISSQRPDL